MKNSNFKSTGIGLSILLSATALLILQLSGGGRLTASSSDEPMNQDLQSGTGFQPVNHGQDAHATSLSSRVIAEHPPVELVEKRDDHTRIWEIVREVETTHPDGSTTVDTVKSHIHEKASGLCYKDATGNFVPSVAEWRETPEGFVIDRCPYRLVMGKTIGTSARYTVEGNDLLLRPAYLIISDGVNEADPRPLTPQTRGSISPDNPSVLRFRSTFGEGYDLEYIAEKGGFHQNLIIANPPQLPDGFNSATASIHLYTELNLDQYLSASGCQLTVEGEPVNPTAADLVTEPSRGGCISFMKAGRLLHAFSISQVTDSSGPGALDKQTTAEKRLMKDPSSGKAYLIESVPLSYFTDNSPTYPITWDYQNITEPISGGTWEPRYTYRVSGNISIDGTLTILPGTTVKLDPSRKITIATNGKVIARGEPYNYITFTRTRDNNCGEIITGPADAAYDRALEILSGSSPESAVQYCKFRGGGLGVDLHRTLTESVAHNIFNGMNIGMSIVYCSATAQNNLMTYCSYYGIFAWAVPSGTYTNNTIDHTATGMYDYGSSSFTAKDNLFSHCTTGIYTNYYAPDIRNNGFYQVSGGQWGSSPVPLSASPDASCSMGNYFLNNYNPGGAQLKDAGSRTALAAGLSDEAFTVLAPGDISPSPYTDGQIWSKIASEVVGSLVDIGYHHCRTDVYLPFDLTISDGESSEGSLTIKPGVVVGILGDSYIMATNGGTLLCVGNPDQGGLVRLTNSKSLSMNIESPQFGVTATNPLVIIDSSASEQSSIQFTRTTWLGWGILINSARYLTTPIQHNVFSLGYQAVHAGLNSGNSLLNNLVHENIRGAYARGNTLVSNCTFDRNETGLEAGADLDKELTIKDCLFTHNSAQGIVINAGAGEVVNDYNGFYGNTQDINGGTWGPHSFSDKPGAPNPLTQSPYYQGIESGWQLHYTLNQSSPLIDAGSRTSVEAGLDIFTTAADGRLDFGTVPEGERGNTVDIGYHFPIGGFEGILYQGYRQTDIALRWNNMTDGCIRAFSFDGHARDEIGNEDGLDSQVSYRYTRYSAQASDPTTRHRKYDYNRAGEFYREVGGGEFALSDVDIGNAPDIQDMDSGTVCAWILAHSMGDGGNPTIYYKRANLGGADAKWLRLSTIDGSRRLVGTVGPVTVRSEVVVPLNQWHHVAMTWEDVGGETKVTLYFDGKSCGSDDDASSPPADSDQHAFIGARKYEDQLGQFVEDNHFDGYIADVFIYNRPLQEDQQSGAHELKWLALNGDWNDNGKEEWLVMPNFGAMGEYENFPLGQFNAATWAAADQVGENKWIWVSEFYVPRVTKISPSGEVLAAISGKKFQVGQTDPLLEGPGRCLYGPWGIDVDASHCLYVADSGNDRIQVFDEDGGLIAKWGTTGYDENPVELEDDDIHFVEPRFLCAKRWENQQGADVYVSEYGLYSGQMVARVTKYEFHYDPEAVPRVKCVAAWGGWADEPPGDPTRPDDKFYDLIGIDLDSEGDVWVCDRGPTGNVSFLKEFTSSGTFNKKFRADITTPLGGYNDFCSALGIVNEGGTDYLYSSGGEMVRDHHIAKWAETEGGGQLVDTFNYFGSGPDQSYSPWGGFPTPWGTILSTCWFGGKAQEWHPDGAWIRTSQSRLRSDGHCVKLRNYTNREKESPASKRAWQKVHLVPGDYRLQFLAFTNGGQVSDTDLEAFAGTEPDGTNAITTTYN
ncbi:MAG: LamG-like jellyroll fold domain-containing protein [bacterium]|nr:LamG-like jellyroll fold domain-containing protein [bacterium]